MTYILDNDVKIYYKNDKVIFLNPNKGTIVKMSSKNKDILDNILQEKYNDSYTDYKKPIIDKLKSSYIIKENTEPKKLSNKLSSVFFMVTEKCNLNCKFCCTNSNPSKNSKSDLNVNEIYSITNKISKLNTNRVIITGGEPFTRNDILDIIDILSSHLDCKIILQSNGLLLTPQIIDRLYNKISQIDISLENIFEKKNERNLLIPILDYLKLRKIKIVFSFVAMPENLKSLREFIDLCVKYDARFTIKTVQLVGRANKSKELVLSRAQTINMYYEVYKYIYIKRYYNYSNIYSYVFPELTPKFTCSACGKGISIMSNGDIYACHSLRYPEFYLGNILNIDYDQINEKLLQNQNSEFYNKCFNIDSKKACKECDFKYLCGGICFANDYKNNENKYPLECDVLKIIREFQMWEYNKKDTAKNSMDKLLKKFEGKVNITL